MNQYLPHAVCLMMDQPLILLHVIFNLSISLAYLVIPFCILIASRRFGESATAREKAMGNRKLVATLFALFIWCCGLTHLMDVLVLYLPKYWWQAFILGITAVFSVTTAAVLMVFGFQKDQDKDGCP